MRTLARLTLASLAVALVAASAADAGQRQKRRSDDFRIVCPTGSVVVGFEGRTGAWVDKIAPVCAPWTYGAIRFGAPASVGRYAGSSEGGHPTTTICSDGYVVGGQIVEEYASPGEQVLLGITFQCGGLTGGRSPDRLDFGPHVRTSESSVNFGCGQGPSDGLPIGIFGKAQRYPSLDIDLVCAPRSAWLTTSPGGANPDRTKIPLPSPLGEAGDWRMGGDRVSSRVLSKGEYPDLPPHGQMRSHEPEDLSYIRYEYPEVLFEDTGYSMLDWCLTWARQCGKPAADAFCALQDPSRPVALDFSQAPRMGSSRPTLVLVGRVKCKEPHCAGFKHITCGN